MNNVENNKEPSKFNAAVNKAVGSIKETTGKVLKDGDMRMEGASQVGKGNKEGMMAKGKEKLRDGMHAAGDALERTGEKLAEKGFDKAGNAIYNTGDKIEHSADRGQK